MHQTRLASFISNRVKPQRVSLTNDVYRTSKQSKTFEDEKKSYFIFIAVQEVRIIIIVFFSFWLRNTFPFQTEEWPSFKRSWLRSIMICRMGFYLQFTTLWIYTVNRYPNTISIPSEQVPPLRYGCSQCLQTVQ